MPKKSITKTSKLASTSGSTTSFTPGPWKRRKEWKDSAHALEVYPDVQVEYPWKPSAVCVVTDNYDEALANARLVSAAPDLYAFAKAYREDLMARGVSESDMDTPAMELLNMADAALAKAIG